MRWLFCVFSLFLFSCSQDVEKPDNLLSEDKMIEILTDIYLHQQASYVKEPNAKPLDYARINSYILQEHGVTVKDFEKSYEYYILSPDLYEPMLVKIRDGLEKRLPEEERLKREQQRKEAEEAAKNNN